MRQSQIKRDCITKSQELCVGIIYNKKKKNNFTKRTNIKKKKGNKNIPNLKTKIK